jgi:flagellar basal-body rod protein FlgC
MGLFDGIDTAGSGLSAQQLRMDITSENLANADTPGYRRQNVSLQSIGQSFGSILAGAGETLASASGGVEVSGVTADATPDKLVYDPSSPLANAQGYVPMPNVDTVSEMTDLIDEQNSYQADVTAMQTNKQLFTQTLGLLK